MGFGSFLRDKVAPVLQDSLTLQQNIMGEEGRFLRDPLMQAEGGLSEHVRQQTGERLFGGVKDQIHSAATGAIEDTGVTAPTLSASEVDPEGKFGALQDIRKEKRGRTAANLAPSSGASILTSTV